jgi:hypothetical protein
VKSFAELKENVIEHTAATVELDTTAENPRTFPATGKSVCLLDVDL